MANDYGQAYQSWLWQGADPIWSGWMQDEPEAYQSWWNYYWTNPPATPEEEAQTWYDWTEADPAAATNYADYFWTSKGWTPPEETLPPTTDPTPPVIDAPAVTPEVALPPVPDYWQDFPTDIGPYAYTQLTPESAEQLAYFQSVMGPVLEQYTGVLDTMASPGAFIETMRPVQRGVNEALLTDWANRGIISSSTADQALAAAAEAVPMAYMQQLLGIADAYSKAAELPYTGVGLGTESYQYDPTAMYDMIADMLMDL